jgi:acetyl-CoA synthetase
MNTPLPHIPSAQAIPVQDVVWRPDETYLRRNRLLRFMQQHGIGSFNELLQRSVQDGAWFWDAVVKDLDLRFYEPYTSVMDTSRGIAWTRWFVGGKYNYVHDALDKHAIGDYADRTAIIYESEGEEVRGSACSARLAAYHCNTQCRAG